MYNSQPIYSGLTVTQWYIILNIVVTALFDVWMCIQYGREASISITFIRACQKNSEIAFIAGLIVAHIFLNVRGM